jgi:S1-C subfamily serine protease
MSRPAAVLGALLACGALLPAGVAAQAEPPQRRVKIIHSDSTFIRSDSTTLRVTVNTARIEQLIHDLMASKAMEQTIGQSLREASGQASDPKKMRQLSEELGRIAQKNAALITTIEMSCAGDRQADGYIGVQFSELQTVMGEDAPQAPPLREYPRIDSVYPGSPASKAGVRRGDVVILIGGEDARRPVQLDKVLRPLTKLPVRVQRDGAHKDITIVVEKRPTDFNSDCANVDQVIGPEFDQPFFVMRSRLPRTPVPPSVFPRSQTPAAAPEAPASPMPPMPPFAGYSYGFSTTNSAIAGATLMPLTDDWRATLGVDNGVLVTKVLPGTPAKDSGLHDGDVIISADGQTVASVRTLSRIVSNAKANAVKLQVIRAGKPQVITLRWQEQP